MLHTVLCWLIGGLAISLVTAVGAIVLFGDKADPDPFLRDCDRLLGRRE